MEKVENKKNGLIQSQKVLYTKLERINQLFKIHFSSLILFFLFASVFIILLTCLLVTGQATTELSQRYGLFGTIVTIIMITVLYLLITQIGIQIIFYRLFIIRGNRSLKQVKVNKETGTALYDGIVPYITNFYAFFNCYSKEKTSLTILVRTFLFLNFFSGFYVFFLVTRFLDAGNSNNLINLFIVIIFFPILFFWLMNFLTSIKIRKQVIKWEKLFPKIEEWAQEVEQFSIENSVSSDEEELP